DGLMKYSGDVRGVEDLSFGVEEGEVFGFLGPNGAGKTTAIRTLMGFQSPTDGTATVLAADITDATALRSARANIGYLPSERGFNENVTGRVWCHRSNPPARLRGRLRRREPGSISPE
ncbi:ATP-binding cassette domain-containing protein, partial [Halobellus sp. Atlit-38R]|uniref:ATP-binding cassette domain-containing protein n=1 Tax=Halobellus sp. Atlit-38R TaxID=2282131 RepID=UPI0037434A34